jgi:hypothetical protein
VGWASLAGDVLLLLFCIASFYHPGAPACTAKLGDVALRWGALAIGEDCQPKPAALIASLASKWVSCPDTFGQRRLDDQDENTMPVAAKRETTVEIGPFR